jgi:hypothetical protein
MTNWKLYTNPNSKLAFSYPKDSLTKLKNSKLNDDKMQSFLTTVKAIPKERIPVWMGYYVASCEKKEGATQIIVISTYGGFFYDEDLNQYFEISADVRMDWLNYLAKAESDLQ